MKQVKEKRVVRGRAAGIILEDVDSKLDLIIEKVESTEKSLHREIQDLRVEMRENVEGIKAVMRYQTERLEKHETAIVSLKEASNH